MSEDKDEDKDRLDIDENLSSTERCERFQYELNTFICARLKEWDLSRFELSGVIQNELAYQMSYLKSIDDDNFVIDDTEDEYDDDDDDDDDDEDT